LPYLLDYLGYRPSPGGEYGIAACRYVFDDEVCGQGVGRGDGEPKEIGVVAGVIGLVVGVHGDGIDADLIRYLCNQAWLQKRLPYIANFAISGHLVSVIGAGGYADNVKTRMPLDVHSTCSP
jgi:hypothetical protein